MNKLLLILAIITNTSNLWADYIFQTRAGIFALNPDTSHITKIFLDAQDKSVRNQVAVDTAFRRHKIHLIAPYGDKMVIFAKHRARNTNHNLYIKETPQSYPVSIGSDIGTILPRELEIRQMVVVGDDLFFLTDTGNLWRKNLITHQSENIVNNGLWMGFTQMIVVGSYMVLYDPTAEKIFSISLNHLYRGISGPNMIGTRWKDAQITPFDSEHFVVKTANEIVFKKASARKNPSKTHDFIDGMTLAPGIFLKAHDGGIVALDTARRDPQGFDGFGNRRDVIAQNIPQFSSALALNPLSKRFCNLQDDSLSRADAQKDFFLKNILRKAIDRVECSEHLATQFQKYLYDISDEISEHIIAQGTDPYDVAIIGGGPIGAIFASNLRAIDGLNAVVIERDHMIAAHFKSKIFNLLTSERESFSWTPFPGSPVEIKDFSDATYENPVFPIAIDLWKQIVITLFASNAGFLNDDVISVEESVNLPKLYTLTMRSGIKIVARNVVFGTGLGELSARLDVQTLSLLKEARPTSYRVSLQPATYIDHLIEWSEIQRKAGRDGFGIFEGKNVAVVGDGNGAKMVIKYLIGNAHPSAYAMGDRDRIPASIFNIGKGFSRNSADGIVDYVKGLAHKIEPLHNDFGNQDKARLTFSRTVGDFAQPEEHRDFDYVIVAGGYVRELEKVLAPMLNQGVKVLDRMTPIHGNAHATKDNEIIASQFVNTSDENSKIFFLGSAMQAQVASIWEFSYKAAAFARLLGVSLSE